MSFFQKNKIENEDQGGKTPVKFNRRERVAKDKPRRKKIKRIIIGVFIALVLGFLTYFGIKTWDTIKKVFSEDTGILNLLTGNTSQQLKGETNGRTNILILGVGDEGHAGAELSDTIMIASYDYKTKNLAMFSIPRDLYVSIPKNGYAKINSAHAYGEQYKYPGGGPALAEATVEKTFDIPIHYFIRVDFSGLKETVDALGGVTVDVENSFCDYNYPVEYKGDTSTVCFTKGKQNMNGVKALQYSRSRHAFGVEGSDFARSKRQQRVMMAIKDKSLSLGTFTNPKKTLDLLSALGNHIKTDFQISELVRFYQITKDMNQTIITKNFDNSPEGLLVASSDTAAGYILQPRTGNFKEIQAVVKNIFLESEFKTEKAKLGVYNATWNTGLANRLGTELTGSGYNVVATGDADTKNLSKTQIIDYSNGTKSATIKALEDKFNVIATKQTVAGSTLDIKVIVGKDYKE